jgi:hypothetical protein
MNFVKNILSTERKSSKWRAQGGVKAAELFATGSRIPARVHAPLFTL